MLSTRDFLYQEGCSYYSNRNYQKALEYSNQIIKINPKDIDALYLKGIALFYLGKHEEEITCYDKILEIEPKYFDALHNKGFALYKQDRCDEAITYFDKALEINPKDIEALNSKGIALYKLKKHYEAIACYDKALEYYNRLIKNEPKYFKVLYHKGIALFALGRYQDSIEWFNKALEINPKDADTLGSIGDALANLLRYQEAITYYDKALEDDPKNSWILDNKNSVLGKLGKDKVAVEYVDRVHREMNQYSFGDKTNSNISENIMKKDCAYNEKVTNQNCATPDCKTKLHDLNSKHCKLCNQRVCIDHLQLHINKYCPKTMYVKYIRKLWLMKRGQNVSSGTYSIVCETCGYVSDFPQLIEYAGQELESHLDNSPECKSNKRTFLEEFDFEPIPKGIHVESSIVRDPTRTLWVCAHCRPPRKFTNHDEYIAHHYTHS